MTAGALRRSLVRKITMTLFLGKVCSNMFRKVFLEFANIFDCDYANLSENGSVDEVGSERGVSGIEKLLCV